MPAASRRAATTVYWLSPLGEKCVLEPIKEKNGFLEVEMLDEIVTIHSRNCLLRRSNDEKGRALAEFEFTLSLDRCQLNWSRIESRKETEVERSIYFNQ